jgi:hypothetical protein
LRKQIAGALVASLLIGSAPGWAKAENATTKPTVEEGAQRQQLRDSIDRAIEGKPAHGTPDVARSEAKASGPELTAVERGDLDTRRADLQTDPVARGKGGVVMLILGTALSIGLSAYVINKAKKDSTTTPSMGRP